MSESSTLPDIDGGAHANAGTASAPSPEQAVAHTQLLQFRHWWNSSFARRRAGEAVSRMWHDYPFGALILDESWAWWSLSKVIVEGQLQALAGTIKADREAEGIMKVHGREMGVERSSNLERVLQAQDAREAQRQSTREVQRSRGHAR